jgi:tetratricopeptide (TPR) repeat protein
LAQVFDVQAAHELLEAGRYSEVVVMCDDFLSRAGTAVTCQVNALLKKAAALRRYGAAWETTAIEVLRDAQDRLGESEPVLRARLLINLMAVYSNMPDSITFGQLLGEYLQICDAHAAARQWLWHAHFNAGLNAVCSFEYAAAAEAFEKAVAFAANEAQAAQARKNMALAYIDSGCASKAGPVLAMIGGDFPVAKLGAKLDVEARYHLEAGDLGAAMSAVEAGLAHPAVTAEDEADLKLTKARIALKQGRVVEAKELTLESLNDAYKANYRVGVSAATKFWEGVSAR